MIKETFDSNKIFSFNFVSSDTIFKEILALDTKKLCRVMMYQPRLLNQMLTCFQFLCPMLLKNFCRF